MEKKSKKQKEVIMKAFLEPWCGIYKKMEKFTEQELKKAHDDNGECRSCGWHALFSEHEYSPSNNEKYPNEYWDACQNSDGEDCSDHRGCYIYPEKGKV